jgi:hypothetical protein
MATHYMKADGSFHSRIWFAKAGRGINQDIGISPTADRHLANGTYSFSLAAFDPRGMDVKDATAQGKETSLYEGMGAQFGSQIWRMAHEARVGDYIYLESENHNLHAVGVISGPYRPREGKFDDDVLRQEGLHALPVRWYPVPNGIGAIQLGRLDNAVFRNIIEKEQLVELLFQLSDAYLDADLHQSDAGAAQQAKHEPVASKSSGKGIARPSTPAEPAPAAQAPIPDSPLGGLTTPIHLARNGVVLFQGIDDAKMLSLIQSKQIVGSDHYYRHGMAEWLLVSHYAGLVGLRL